MGLEGRLLGNRYEIIEQIGNGGMATVYKAKCHVLNRYVAVKILRDEFTTDEEFIKRFNTEAQAVASLTHPNIVSVYDVGHEGNLYYIVMELIKGRTLKEIIVSEGAPAWKWCVNVAIQIASALETAHKNNIIHRDIKPHNIIITEDGIAKVTDFGIAKAVSNSTITAFGTTIGSVHYFSPEHARGGYTDAKSDIYSLGVVMYEMLTGRVPFDADTPVSIALKHMQEKPVEPIKLNPSIPLAINKIIMKAMEKDISLRYQSATEMLKDLSMSLKDPEGNFVKRNSETMQYTQRIPSLNEEMEEGKTRKSSDKKKKGLAKYFEEHPTAKKVWITVIALAIIVLIPLIGYGVTKLVLDGGKTPQVALKDVKNMTVDEAKAAYKNDKVTIEIEEVHDKEVEEGKIISQEPPYVEGKTVDENSTIKFIVSLGVEKVEMKKVVGMKFDEAKELLEGLELEVEKIEETSKTVEKDYVTKQDPEEGEELKTGDKVKVYVSIGTGIKKINVPYVIGETESNAKKKLSDLEVTVVYEEDTTKVNGKVLKQSIDAGESVDEGTKITITVNRIEAIKSGTIKLNLKSLLGADSSIDTDPETGAEINSAVNLRIQVGEDNVYRDTVRKDSTDITATASGKGTVTVKIFVDEIKKKEVQFDLSVENPTLVID